MKSNKLTIRVDVIELGIPLQLITDPKPQRLLGLAPKPTPAIQNKVLKAYSF